MRKFNVVKCGDEESPCFWGFIFDNRQDAVRFSVSTCFGKPDYRKLSDTVKDVVNLVDCRGCGDVGLGCSTCSKPDEFFESEMLNEHFQEDI